MTYKPNTFEGYPYTHEHLIIDAAIVLASNGMHWSNNFNMSQESITDDQPQAAQLGLGGPAASTSAQPMTLEDLARIVIGHQRQMERTIHEMQEQMDARILELRTEFDRRFREMKEPTGSPIETGTRTELSPPATIESIGKAISEMSEKSDRNFRELREKSERDIRELRQETAQSFRELKDRLSLTEIRAQAALDRSSVASSQGIRRSAFSLDDIASVGQRDRLRRRRPFL